MKYFLAFLAGAFATYLPLQILKTLEIQHMQYDYDVELTRAKSEHYGEGWKDGARHAERVITKKFENHPK